MKPLSTFRAITASIAVVVLLAYVTTFAAAPSVLPDFLRPSLGWKGLVPSFFGHAGADNPGTPRVQGVSNGYPMPTSPGVLTVPVLGSVGGAGATVTTTGSKVIADVSANTTATLNWNILASPTGTTPTITFTLAEVDPGNQITAPTGGLTSSSSSINAIGSGNISITGQKSTALKASWTVTGTSPSFTQVFVTLTASGTSTTQGIGAANAPAGGVQSVINPTGNTAPFPVKTFGTDNVSANAADQNASAATLSTACTLTTACLNTASIQWPMNGASASEVTITASSSPLGFTSQVVDASYDATGTTYTLAKCVMVRSDATSTGTVKTALVNADLTSTPSSWEIMCPGAPSWVRFRIAGTPTSGSFNAAGHAVFAPGQARTQGAAIALGAPLNAAGSNIGQAMMAVSSTTATTGVMVRASANGVLVDTGAVVTAASTAPVTGSAALTIVESPNSLGCAGQKVTTTNFKPVNITTGTQLITGTAAQNVYICSIDLVVGAADNVALVEGTGTVCATGIAGMAGGTTAATGWNFTANGGLQKGDGFHAQYKTATQADNVCLLVSGAAQVSGSMTWVSF